MDIHDTHPWDRQAGETPCGYAAFLVYRDIAPSGRSLGAAAQAFYRRPTGAAPAQVKQCQLWSRTYQWGNRAALWDQYQADERARLERETEIEAYREMIKRHMDLSRNILRRVEMRLIGGRVRDLDGKEIDVEAIRPDDLTPGMVLKWFEVGVAQERQARGVIDQAMANFDTGRVSGNMEVGAIVIDRDLKAEMLVEMHKMGFKLEDLDGPEDAGPLDAE